MYIHKLIPHPTHLRNGDRRIVYFDVRALDTEQTDMDTASHFQNHSIQHTLPRLTCEVIMSLHRISFQITHLRTNKGHPSLKIIFIWMYS